MKTVSGLAAALVVCGLAGILRHTVVDGLAAVRSDVRLDDDGLKSPGPVALKAASFEHALGIADTMWLSIVQELGFREDESQPSYDRVERWSNIATDLDPDYFTIYYSSAIHLTTYAKRVEASDALLLKGMERISGAWQLPFMVAYNAFFLRADPKRAEKYWLEAAKIRGAPRFIPSLLARVRAFTGNPRDSIRMLQQMLNDNMFNDVQRKDAEIRIRLLKAEIEMEEYDRACKEAVARGEERPTVQALFMSGAVKAAPKDVFGTDIVLDDECVARSGQVRVRSFELGSQLGKESKTP